MPAVDVFKLLIYMMPFSSFFWDWCIFGSPGHIRSGGLPKRLKVTEYLCLEGCSELEKLPEDLDLDILDVTGCTNLKGLPSSLRVRQLIDRGDADSFPRFAVVPVSALRTQPSLFVDLRAYG